MDTTTEQRGQGEQAWRRGSDFRQRRAARLRAQAASMHPLVARAYCRRAAELELLACVAAGRDGLDRTADAEDLSAA